MSFTTVQYALFLPLVVALHWVLPRRLRTPLLLVASYVFYASWAWRFCLLLAFTTTVDWAVARGYADPDRVAIVGGSYGGYAALVRVTVTPEKSPPPSTTSASPTSRTSSPPCPRSSGRT